MTKADGFDFHRERTHYVSIRIIKEAFLKAAATRHPKAASQLNAWRKIVLAARWKNLIEVRGTFPSADSVRTGCGHNVYVFNICRNEFRLIAAIHFNRQRIFTLRFLTHAEHSKNKWINEL